jgi:hypothetical protein
MRTENYILLAAGAVGLATIGGAIYVSRRAHQLGYDEAIPGGRAAGRKPSDFDPTQLLVGTLIELEHTNDPYQAREISMDHLAEDKVYYSGLCQLHKEPACRLLAA